MLYAYPVHTTHKSAVTTAFHNMILTDGMSGKNFSEIVKSVEEYRLTQYLKQRCNYTEAVQLWKSVPRVHNSHTREFADFSTFEDAAGWNESRAPTDDYVRELFTAHCEKHQTLFGATLNNIVPFVVQSVDATYESSTRTKGGMDPHSRKKEPIPEKCIIFSMNGTGQISSFSRSVNDRWVGWLLYVCIT